VRVRLIFDFSNDFLDKVQAKIDETWEDAPPEYLKPDLEVVMLHAFDSLAEWATNDAPDLAKCNKLDSCTAQAIVLQELAELFRRIIL
jgi:hypothetical protein